MKRLLITLSLLAALGGASSASAQGPSGQHLLYLPDNTTAVDHLAIIRAFESDGFTVETHAYTNESQTTFARNIASRIRELMHEGVDPANISVLGAGWGSDVALLTSAATGNRHVNYVVLGSCNRELKDYRVRLAGNVMALRDAAGSASQSCRPLFTQSPRLSARKDLKLVTPYGSALFSTAREEWTRPASQWMRQGKVDVGDINVAMMGP